MPNTAQRAETPTQQAGEGTIAAARDVRLPPFCSTDAVSWFQRAEIQFRLKKVTCPGTKADLVLASLPEDIFPKMSTWIAEHTNEDTEMIDYKELKQELLRKFVASPEEKAERILTLSKQPLGDQRPSEALQEMRTTSTIMDAQGNTSTIPLLTVLWLLRLPDVVRQGMPRFAHRTDGELGELADSLMCTYRQTSNGAAYMVDEEEEIERQEEIAAAASWRRKPRQVTKVTPTYVEQQATNKTKPSRGYAPKKASQPKLCFYHKRFGLEAQHCTILCP